MGPNVLKFNIQKPVQKKRQSRSYKRLRTPSDQEEESQDVPIEPKRLRTTLSPQPNPTETTNRLQPSTTVRAPEVITSTPNEKKQTGQKIKQSTVKKPRKSKAPAKPPAKTPSKVQTKIPTRTSTKVRTTTPAQQNSSGIGTNSFIRFNFMFISNKFIIFTVVRRLKNDDVVKISEGIFIMPISSTSNVYVFLSNNQSVYWNSPVGFVC